MSRTGHDRIPEGSSAEPTDDHVTEAATAAANGAGTESPTMPGSAQADPGSTGAPDAPDASHAGPPAAPGGESAEPGVAGADDDAAPELSVEALVTDLERVSAERDQYLEASRRIQAEFENYRKQVSKREVESRERANESLIGEMLPVLDAFDGAVSSGIESVLPMRNTLLDALGKQGLERIEPGDAPFDPNQHEAVMHEDGDGEEPGPVVAEVMRPGYSWKGRVIRPAMVRVRG